MQEAARSSAPDRAVEAGRGALFIGFAKVFFMVTGALQKLLLTRVVGLAEYGIFTLVNDTIGIVNNTVVQGTIQSVSKFTAEDEARAEAVKRAGLRLHAVMGTALGLALVLGAPLIARSANAPGHVLWFRLVAAIPFLYAFYTVFVGTANGLRRFRTQATFDVTFSTLKTILLLGGAFVGVSLGHGVTGAFLGFVAAAAIIVVVAARTMRMPASSASFPASRLFMFMVRVFAYTLLLNMALSYDGFLLRRFAGAVLEGAQADALVGQYGGVRALALLPYQALVVVTFVMFPLISRSTFAQDREVTRAYVTQTLRYAVILGAAMATVLAARPLAIFRVVFPASYAEGAGALPILVAGMLCLALLSVAGSMINASGRPEIAVVMVATTVATGGSLAWLLVRAAEPGPAMLQAAATATSLGMAAGLVLALLYLWRRFGATIPLATLTRVVTASAAAIAVGRVAPGQGKIVGLALLVVSGLVFAVVLLLLREFGDQDRAKFRKILGRGRR